MRKIELEVNLFSGPGSEALSEAALRLLLEALVIANQIYLRQHPECPSPYDVPGLRWEQEPIGVEDWQSIPYILERKRADCEDLAAYLCAWRRERNGIVSAVCDFTHRNVRLPGGVGVVSLYHIVVRLPDGRIEDPSRKLGMP